VSILAYAAGEEDFVDANFNNVYDCLETWTDLTNAYRDDAATSPGSTIPGGLGNAFIAGEFSVPRSSSSSACGAGVAPSPVAGDSVWGVADVRSQAIVIFSTDGFNVVSPLWSSAADPQWNNGTVTTGLTVQIQDLNGNSVPTGSTILVEVVDNSAKSPSDGAATPAFGACTLVSQSNKAVPNALGALTLSVALKQCAKGDQIVITVTTPAQAITFPFTVPN
jgi:hypothetical protein